MARQHLPAWRKPAGALFVRQSYYEGLSATQIDH